MLNFRKWDRKTAKIFEDHCFHRTLLIKIMGKLSSVKNKKFYMHDKKSCLI